MMAKQETVNLANVPPENLAVWMTKGEMKFESGNGWWKMLENIKVGDPNIVRLGECEPAANLGLSARQVLLIHIIPGTLRISTAPVTFSYNVVDEYVQQFNSDDEVSINRPPELNPFDHMYRRMFNLLYLIECR
jgi:hypothetical protein